MTPEPTYFKKKKQGLGNLKRVLYLANKGKNDPMAEAANTTNIDEILYAKYSPL